MDSVPTYAMKASAALQPPFSLPAHYIPSESKSEEAIPASAHLHRKSLHRRLKEPKPDIPRNMICGKGGPSQCRLFHGKKLRGPVSTWGEGKSEMNIRDTASITETGEMTAVKEYISQDEALSVSSALEAVKKNDDIQSLTYTFREFADGDVYKE
ncbi:hypothetical protein HPP92_014915 [Vanilla planifolia]|uniref:Uncharacterized protein n=1 Tax=Vanilla planifolia TaxID=51239 RepID=A0A835QR19_VANPL|nr:hypothetical protein HPP92_014915 [Vanilla planifolia]